MIPWLGNSQLELHDASHLDHIYGVRFYRAINHESFCYNIILRVYKFEAPIDNYRAYMLANTSPGSDPFILWFSDINDLATFETNDLFQEYIVDYGQPRIHCKRWQDVLNRMVLDKLTSEPQPSLHGRYGSYTNQARSVGPKIEVIFKEPMHV